MTGVRWVSLFADVPAGAVRSAIAFWCAVTGAGAADPVGARGEYLPLRPGDGDPYLYLQRLDDGEPGWHPDLHVADLADAVPAATRLGAAVVRVSPDLVTFSSPGGMPFCLVADDRSDRRPPSAPVWPGRHSSRLDQLCLDIPDQAFEDECAFWSGLTGWPVRTGTRTEYRHLARPDDVAVRFLLQRLGADDPGPPRAHADLATDDRPAETDRHRALGATVVRVAEGWTTLRAPGGHAYCITDRTP